VKPELVTVGTDAADLHGRIHIALANVGVSPANVEASYLGKPNDGKRRLKPFSDLLNHLARYTDLSGRHLDLVVLPEVSVPHSWEQMVVSWARKHHIGVICGLEHRIKGNSALNEVLAALPYRAGNHHWACAVVKRLKRIYSPREAFVLEQEHLKVPLATDPYQLIRWRGASFSIYNCFELASIRDRALFKSRVDFIVGTEFNPDTNYFSNIVESVSRDIHCYVVQVNDSTFGDSRVVSPSSTERMNPVRIKGGENLTFLSTWLDLKSLREHQRKGYGLQKESAIFKPTPPGFSVSEVQKRIALGDV
jgi:hypothetical protein